MLANGFKRQSINIFIWELLIIYFPTHEYESFSDRSFTGQFSEAIDARVG